MLLPINHLHSAVNRFKNRYIHRRKPRRLHTTNKKINLENFQEIKQPIDHKPKGIWYGIADAWIDWCLSEGYDGIHQYIYEVVLDDTKILKINNIQDFEKFETEYSDIPNWAKDDKKEQLNEHYKKILAHRYYQTINYGKVAENFAGLEITPYLWEKRLKSIWYYGWDCASGCIWDVKAIKELKLFAEYNAMLGEFVKI